jgi:hypothetical protein
MYVDAIEHVDKFTRPIHNIFRTYESEIIQAGAVTLFFVNSDGWALTCRHVADQLIASEHINKRYSDFKHEIRELSGKKKLRKIRKELEKKYGFKKGITIEIRNRFINCIEGPLNSTILRHSKADIALIRFENYTRLLCEEFPIFASDSSSLKPGKMLCRLGYAFAEFTNFEYNHDLDQISWTQTGKSITPRFPIEGMVTRRLLDDQGKVLGFEMSTPGLRGQSGGPVFDSKGVIWGLQAMTKHLDLDFDINQEVLRQGQIKRVHDHAFLHVGGCIHIEIIKNFLRENNVSFKEG